MMRRLSLKKDKKDDGGDVQKKLLVKVMDFLNSAIWGIPIASFIEQKSIVFDRQQMEPGLYEQIHKEYTNLIDTLIECFCEDVGSTPDKLVEALKTLDRQQLSIKQRASLEPLAAAQDFNVFVPMMMRKNIELQLQALQMIEFMCGLIPAVLQLEEGETLRERKNLSPEETERYVLISVMRQSKDEFDAMHNDREQIELMMRDGQTERHRLESQLQHEEDNGPQIATSSFHSAVRQEGVSVDVHEPPAAASKAEQLRNGPSAGESKKRENKDIEPNTTNERSEEKDQSKGSSRESRPSSSKRTTTTAASVTVVAVADIETAPAPLPITPAKSSTERPPTRKNSGNLSKDKVKNDGLLPQNGDTLQRPDSKHSSRRESTERAKPDERPSTRRSSVDRTTPKRNDSVPSDRRTSASRSRAEPAKPPKPPGPIREPRYPGEQVAEPPESPGHEHGPRRKNLNDVHSHLVDADRLNSADVRSRAEYLRMQRDRLLEMKRQERIKHINEVAKTTQERPRTAKAARGAMRGRIESSANVDVIAARRAIADKLKAEILTLDDGSSA